jgi:hypothetical protein
MFSCTPTVFTQSTYSVIIPFDMLVEETPAVAVIDIEVLVKIVVHNSIVSLQGNTWEKRRWL